MEKVTLNKELTFTFPDGFHIMDAQEKSSLNFAAEGEGFCLSDPDRHVIITTAWQRLGMVSSMLLTAKDVAKTNEAQYSDAMMQNNYKRLSRTEREIAGFKVNGYNYEYIAGGTSMYGESVVIKSGKTMYYLHFYSRADLKEPNISCWEGILSSLEKN